MSATGTLTHSMDQIVELGNLDKSTSQHSLLHA